jgi:tripartite-type tricarboxylate transporter receptor subunit TctC
MKRFAFLIGAVLAASFAWAQPALVRIVVPFPPGGSNDVIARAMAPQLAKRLGTNVIVENKGGAAGVIGSDAVAKAPPDGSHLYRIFPKLGITARSHLRAALENRSPTDSP